ncbi:hypothetical protein OIO90_002208 [Microbotryomycetes sp. JL221]|nr:hypothetical protein OIO90_002208 [Microbotryomycetes sp. JL221]
MTLTPEVSPKVDVMPLPSTPQRSSTRKSASSPALAASPSVTKYVHQPQLAKRRPRPLEFVNTADGRDAGLRIIQYSLRFALYVRQRAFSKPTLSSLLATVSLLSALRRIVALYDISSYLYHALSPSSLFGLLSPRGGAGVDFESKQRRASTQWTTDDMFKFVRATLDVVSVVADNVFLASRIGVTTPWLISKRTARRADRVAEMATLVAALLGLAQVKLSRQSVRAEGREVRKLAIVWEQKLDELEFWEPLKETQVEQYNKANQNEPSPSKTRDAEERRLRERIRASKKKLKDLRNELSALWWERLRLICEATFATWDTLELETASEGIKAVSGFVSASIMLSQAWSDYRASSR